MASGKLLLDGGEILVSKLNPEKSAVLLAEHHEIPTMCSPEFIVLIPRAINRRFAYFFMLSAPLRHQLNASVESVTNSHKRARVDRFLASKIELPDLDTQKAIADFLDRETARIDEIIGKTQQSIALLGERRAVLITAAVTGQIAVTAYGRAGVN
ncbi:MAG: restriction endonuclease subunit S [Rhodospirillales bacterium]|nr:restriction endonuclease subunit S [Rhodospirillales bacterium]